MSDRNCCDGECLQGRSCPYREAARLEDLPAPQRKASALCLLAWATCAVAVLAAIVAGVVR